MTAGEIIGFVGGLIAAISAITAIVAFFIARGKDHYKEGSEDSGMRGDIKYMRNSFDELRLDVKEIARKQDNASGYQRCERIACGGGGLNTRNARQYGCKNRTLFSASSNFLRRSQA